MNKKLLFFLLLTIKGISALSQVDPFTGNWQWDNNDGSGIHFTLKIGSPEKRILYPASVIIKCDSFNATYELLLVKKSGRELAISKNKFARNEKPFSIAPQLFYINGLFDLSRDLKGRPTLNLNRIQPVISNNITVPDTVKKDAALLATFNNIRKLLTETDIKLYKQNGLPWSSDYADRILTPSVSPAYFGLTDTIYVPSRDGTISLSDPKKGDINSVAVNEKRVVDLLELGKKEYTQDILLDTGMNILVFFAENFANNVPNRGHVKLELGKKKIDLDFSNHGDSAASFIAIKLYFASEKDKETFFDGYTPVNDRPLKANEKLLGTLTSTAKQLTLAIWDDAVEDGDSISINVNGKWIARGFPVKIKPQTITITLEPGPNTITFIADNLGSIPPNTSILEIIDGKRRKSFTLATIIGEDNLVKILYENGPGK